MEFNEKNILVTINEDIKVESGYWPAGDYPLHYHDHLEMELVVSGHGYQYFNGQTMELNKGDLFLLRPLDYHKIHSNEISFKHIKVKSTILPKWILKRLHALKNPIVNHLSLENYEKFNYLFSLLEEEIENQHDEFLDNRINLVVILFNYFLRLDGQKTNAKVDDVISRILYFLQKNNHFVDKITLDEIAENIGYSKYYTSYVFHKIYGMTIQDFIINQRIEYAKKMMLETNYSINEIISECGFPSSSNFYAKFYQKVGCSPLKFKKQNQVNVHKGVNVQNESLS